MNKRIRELREKLGLSQTKFAERMGMTRSMVSNMELGLVDIPEYRIGTIIKEFGVNRHWLETGEGEMLKPKSNADLISGLTDSPVIRAILEAYLELTPQERKIFENYVSDVCRRYAESQTPPGDAAMSAARAGKEPRPVQPESLSG